jgi:hypothetical protein
MCSDAASGELPGAGYSDNASSAVCFQHYNYNYLTGGDRAQEERQESEDRNARVNVMTS